MSHTGPLSQITALVRRWMWHGDGISFPTGSDLIPQRSSGLWGLSGWAPGCWASFMQEPPPELPSEAASDSRGGGGGGESQEGIRENPSPVGLNRNVAALWNQEVTSAEQFYQFTFPSHVVHVKNFKPRIALSRFVSSSTSRGLKSGAENMRTFHL